MSKDIRKEFSDVIYPTMVIRTQAETIELQEKEIERLNNIINEFNKLIENEINESKLEEDYERVDAMKYCLATLRELKGSDKE